MRFYHVIIFHNGTIASSLFIQYILANILYNSVFAFFMETERTIKVIHCHWYYIDLYYSIQKWGFQYLIMATLDEKERVTSDHASVFISNKLHNTGYTVNRDLHI